MMCGIVEDDGTHAAMMSWRVMFGKIIRQIVSAWGPEDIEVSLLRAVADPIEPHVDCAGSALFAGSVGDAVGGGIVGLKWSGGLWMAHFFKSCSEYCPFLSLIHI